MPKNYYVLRTMDGKFVAFRKNEVTIVSDFLYATKMTLLETFYNTIKLLFTKDIKTIAVKFERKGG